MHTTVYEQNQLNSRTQRISSSPRLPSTSTMPSSSLYPTSASSSSRPADSPASLTSSTSSPGAHSDPGSAAPGLPHDYLPNVVRLTGQLSRALRLLSTSHQLLSFPTLRARFPASWARASASEIAACGGDGGERLVDPDWVDGGWGWPLVPTGDMLGGGGSGGSGPGAGGMLPHLVVFGRSVLAEWIKGRNELRGERYDLASGFAR